MKRIVAWLAVAGILALLLLPRLLKDDPAKGGPGGPKGQQGPINVEYIVTRTDTLDEQVTVTGTLMANEQVQLSSEVNGRVTGIYFTEGGSVSANQLLVKLNDTDLQAQLAKAERQLELARTAEQRVKALLAKDAVSKEEYDQASTEVAVKQSEIDLLKAQIAKTEIRAPFAGRIGLRKISPGAYLSTGSPIASLQSTGQLKLEFELPEKYAAYVHEGMSLRFSTPGTAGKFGAIVYALEPGISTGSRSIQVRAILANPGSLKPGGFADVELPLQRIEGAIMLPTEAIVPGSKGDMVWLVQADTLTPRPVVTGFRTGARVQVAQGLKAGEKVLVSGTLQARPGAKVIAKQVSR